jgi:DNA-binding LacI/PurR family transcriptional regulator
VCKKIFMTATIKSIAKLTGVSHSTVSRALRGSSLVAKDTSQYIQRVAGEQGYLPSAAARSLKTRRTQALGVILSSIADPFFAEILFGIEEYAQESNYSLLIAASQHDLVKERRIVQAMVEQRTDGLIICSSLFSQSQVSQLLSRGFPVVMVNQQAAENYNFSIYHDDLDGSRQITRYLISLGHKRIAYLGNANSGRTTQDRLAGFMAEMDESDLVVPEEYVHHVAGGDPELGWDALAHFMDLEAPPSAIFCFNDMLAVGVLKGCEERGIEVPRQLSVAGFDNIAYSAFTTPSLTTFDQPKREIGHEAARLLLDLLASDQQGLPQIQQVKVLQGKLLVRESTGSPIEKEGKEA